jgi:hypothetical protein
VFNCDRISHWCFSFTRISCKEFLQHNQVTFNFLEMKIKFYTYVAVLATVFTGIIPAMGHASTINDSVTMGQSYSNEIYYSMSAGELGSASRSTWDIAFRANWMSASILTNDGSAVELYTYPKSDTTGWATVDTTGITNWTKMYNSTTDWEEGAFCRNQKGHPDYGWGKYNQSGAHPVIGDSLFIIKLRDGSFRKLWIIQKISSDNIYEFRFANLDNTGDTKVSLDCNLYSTKNFVGYSITTNQVEDYEPVAKDKWDILFTKYMGINNGQPYPVVGVLSNYNVKVLKLAHVATDTILTDIPTMDLSRSAIGYDWKTFTGGAYKVSDSLVYFVQDLGGKIHRLIFTKFKGSSTGLIAFNKELNSLTGVNKIEKSGLNAAIYPNPVKDVMNLVVNPGKSGVILVSLLNMTGKTVFSKNYELPEESLSTVQIPVSDFTSGMYVVRIQVGTSTIARKVIVNK